MKFASVLLSLFLLIVFCQPAKSESMIPLSIQDMESRFYENGKPLADSDSYKSKNGFGIGLHMTDDESIYENWQKPEPPKINVTSKAIRNKPFTTLMIFSNPGIDSESNADVTADMRVINPDGTIALDKKDLEIWKRKYTTPRNHAQIALGSIQVIFNDEDQDGVYRIEAIVKDRIKGVTLDLKTDITLE